MDAIEDISGSLNILVKDTVIIPPSIPTPINSSGSVYLSGSTASGSVFSGSTASGHIILTHPDTSVTVDIPTQNLIITASGTWDGILNAPRTVT